MSWAPKQTIVLPLPDMKTEAYDPVAMSSSLACSSGYFHFCRGRGEEFQFEVFTRWWAQNWVSAPDTERHAEDEYKLTLARTGISSNAGISRSFTQRS